MLLPLKVDVPMWRTPWVNYALIGTIVVASVVGFSDIGYLAKMAGIQVSINGDDVSASLTPSIGGRMLAGVTSTFLHSGWLHLIGNMWFLWVFGNAINYKFGHAQYLGLYLLAGWLGSMLHYACTGSPVIGASGAINGVVGAFLVLFPKNNVTVAWIWGIWGSRFSVSSYWIIIYWLAWDIGSLLLSSSSQVAYWAHVGGFLAGFVVAFACVKTKLIKPTEDEQTLLQVFAQESPKRRYY